jgi:hypothetical protein
MKLYFTDQTNHLQKHLSRLKEKQVRSYDKSTLSEKRVSTLIYVSKPLAALDLRFFFDYNIFPDNLLTFLAQWHAEEREMRVGDTIVQQTFIPPIRSFSKKIVFGSRISEITDTPTRKSFSYETLQGHPERGINSFIFEEKEGKVTFSVHVFTTPGNLLTRLVGPVFTMPYVEYSIRQALQHVKEQAERYNP